jgi:hypothetical protein
MDQDSLQSALRAALDRSARTREVLRDLLPEQDPLVATSKLASNSYYLNQDILESLQAISNPLANSYLQIIAEFEDESRITWDGTAHQIRELLRKLLDLLAPTNLVEQQVGYKQEMGLSGPTQKQRVKYILAVKGGGSKQQAVVQNIALIEDKIGNLVRDTYQRASDAAHRSKDKTEAFRILRYFEAFAYDLLNIGT